MTDAPNIDYNRTLDIVTVTCHDCYVEGLNKFSFKLSKLSAWGECPAVGAYGGFTLIYLEHAGRGIPIAVTYEEFHSFMVNQHFQSFEQLHQKVKKPT